MHERKEKLLEVDEKAGKKEWQISLFSSLGMISKIQDKTSKPRVLQTQNIQLNPFQG